MTPAPLVVVTGTGTGIGKTHLSAALVTAWASGGRRIAGVKPIESGGASDVAILERMSTFHVKRYPMPYMLGRPVSPHLAARGEGRVIEIDVVVDLVARIRSEADGVVVELPGGLFSPLAPGTSNATLLAALAPALALLVAPDRLGVLHDVGAATVAAAALGVRLDGVVLVAPETPDTSTGSNATELPVVTGVPLVASVPRAPVELLAEREDVRRLVSLG